MVNLYKINYPISKENGVNIKKQHSPKYSVGGIRLKILSEISRYEHGGSNVNPLGYKERVLVDLYKELFG